MSELTPTVAIIGSGPAGCYCAQFLKKSLPSAEVIVFEALPVPYGLLRYGIAADHQGSKNISAQFERMFTRGGVCFIGNTEIGKDISLDELKAAFDVVVVATGLSADRKLGITGDDLISVVGAGQLLRTLNGYPDSDHALGYLRPLGQRVVVVGNGNVAMDVVRLIAKSEEELSGSDINDEARQALCTSGVRRIDVIGRSSVEQAKFDLAMLREICHLKHAIVRCPVKAATFTGPAADLLLSNEATTNRARDVMEINFHFSTTPVLISSDNQTTVLTLKQDGEENLHDICCDTLITAVGFCHGSGHSLTATGSYSVGWVRRGPKGTVAENRRDAAEVADEILGDLRSGRLITGKTGLKAVEHKIAHKAVSFTQWKILDRHEIHHAAPGRCRKKTTSLTEMLSVMAPPVLLPE